MAKRPIRDKDRDNMEEREAQVNEILDRINRHQQQVADFVAQAEEWRRLDRARKERRKAER